MYPELHHFWDRIITNLYSSNDIGNRKSLVWWSWNVYKKCPSPDVSWKPTESYGEQFVIAPIQVFSKKPQTSSEAGPIKFYLLYMFAFNFAEDARGDQITHHRTLLAFSPLNSNF